MATPTDDRSASRTHRHASGDSNPPRMARCTPVPISSRPPPAVTLGNEEGLGVYREEEAYPVIGHTASRDLRHPLDGGGGDPRPARVGALTDLDDHAYHVRATSLFRSASPPDEARNHGPRRGSSVINVPEGRGRGIP